MARLIQKLTEAKIRTLTDIKLHPDGAGLNLQVKPGGARSWIYRFTLSGRTRDMGLGALADVSLVKAREKASAARALVNDGIDPIEHTRAQAVIPVAPKRHSSPTFEEVAESYMADRLKRLRSEPHTGTIPPRHNAETVMLDFVKPTGTGRRSLRWRRQTRFDNPQPGTGTLTQRHAPVNRKARSGSRV